MAQRKRNSTSSGASTVGQPNHSVAEIKERYELEKKNEEDRLKALFDSTEEALRKIKDPKSRSNSSTNKYTRNNIRTYMQNVANNGSSLRKASRYFYYASQIYKYLIHFMTDMWQLGCRQLIPPYTLIKNNDPTKTRKVYENTLDWLEAYNIEKTFYEIVMRCYLEDVAYVVFVRDVKQGSVALLLDADDCVIDSEYLKGGFGFSLKTSNYKRGAKADLAEWFGEPFTSALKEAKRTGEDYIHLDDRYAMALKFDLADKSTPVVPFSGLFSSLSTMLDIADNQAIVDSEAIYKLLAIPLDTLTSTSRSDDFKVSPTIMAKYISILNELLPSYTSSALIPGGLTNDNVIDFSTTSSDQDVDRIETNQKNFLNTSGGGVLLGANNVKLTEEYKDWRIMMSSFAITSLLPQIEGHINRFLSYDVSGDHCKVKFFPVTIYTKAELQKSLLESCTYSFSNRLAYNTFLGISERATLAMEYMESDVLGLPGMMNHPLQSSYTQSGEVGRPETDSGELTDSGERSRNS